MTEANQPGHPEPTANQVRLKKTWRPPRSAGTKHDGPLTEPPDVQKPPVRHWPPAVQHGRTPASCRTAHMPAPGY